jgi:hypothetical protein
MIGLRSYSLPKRGTLLLACGKCQRRLKHDGDPANIASLKKAAKKITRETQPDLRLRVLKVPCLKLCPRDGITVCTPAQVTRSECSIVRTPTDLKLLVEALADRPASRKRVQHPSRDQRDRSRSPRQVTK